VTSAAPRPPGADARLASALGRLFFACQARAWPGSAIPALAHPLEVASRVAAWGGSEDEILAALLHDVPGAGPGALVRFLGEPLAAQLEQARGCLPPQGQLPPDPEPGLPGPLRRVVACDLLSHARGLLLDWASLADGWEVRIARLRREGRPQDEDWWLSRDSGLALWTGYPEDCRPLRPELVAAYRSWMTLPLPAAPAPFPALSLVAPDHPAWEAWDAWAEVLDGWGLPALAQEARALRQALADRSLEAQRGFLETWAADPAAFTAGNVAQCLRHLDLAGLEALARDEGCGAFMAQVPAHLRERCRKDGAVPVPGPGWHRSGALALLSDLFEKLVGEGRLTLAPAPRPWAEPSEPAGLGAPTLQRLRQALAHAEPWPLTSIPKVWHALEAFSLVLTAGGGEALALKALPGPPPEPATPPRSPAGRLLTACQTLSRFRWLSADFAALTPSWGGDPQGRRSDLLATLTLMRTVLHGQPLQDITEAVLLKGRLGFDREGLLDGSWPKGQWGRRHRPGEIELHHQRMVGPEDDLTLFPEAICRLHPRQREWLGIEAGARDLALAGQSEPFRPALASILQALPRKFAEDVRYWLTILPEPDAEAIRLARKRITDLLEGRIPEESWWWYR